ncbi:MAG: type II toxin-antitoxin system RelB/DinJ family antitoxin [Ruminococcaceae bacterium]|nr:type II toxin-antitoxin system RelB/DinJ family antitoxin [Oscillospiraceae bacterium]
MSQATFSVRMDDSLKKEFDNLCSDFGMSMSTAITVFAKAVVRERKIPFEISAQDPFYSEKNLKYLAASLEAYRSGKLTSHELIEVDDE